MNTIMRYLLTVKTVLNTYICQRLPIYKNSVLFYSSAGMYNDNPRYISEALHKKRPDINIYWGISSKCHEKLPSYIIPINCIDDKYIADSGNYRITMSNKFINILCRASVIVDNGVGVRSCHGSKNVFRNFAAKMISSKRKDQLNISTWHGTPLKKIGPDSISYSGGEFYISSNEIIAGCKYTKDILFHAFGGKTAVKLYGTPRNDILFDKKVDIEAVKDKLHLPKGKKIVLFAPTFRKEIEYSGINQMKMFDVSGILQALCERFGENWVFVFRLHGNVIKELDINGLISKYGDLIVDGNIGDDMAEYLLCTDVLITDYSSSFFDFALLKKPCFLFAPDRENYEKIERGFYIDYDSLPFPISYSGSELISQISDFDMPAYVNDVNRFLADIGNIEDGCAADRIVDNIIKFIETSNKL